MRSRSVGRLLLVAAALLPGGCNLGDRAAGLGPTDAPCTGGAALALEPLRGATLDCSAGTTVTLPPGRASYLVVAQLAVGDVAASPMPYRISVPSGAVLSVSPTAAAPPAHATAALVRAAGGPGVRQALLDAGLRAAEARLVAGGATAGLRGASADASPVVAGSVPELGSTRGFHILATAQYPYARYAPVSAALRYSGDNLLIYVDVAAADAFSDEQIGSFGALFDQVLYPLDLATFGGPSDIDGNGRLIMLLSPVVNALTPRSQCGPLGYVAGFVMGNDLVKTDSTSNRGEVFYAMVPDVAGKYSCPHTLEDVTALMGSTFLHETQHLISYAQHVLVNGGRPQAGWLDEGLSLVAEELGATYYESRLGGLSPTARSPLADSARAFLTNVSTSARAYLLRPDTVSLTAHDDSDAATQWRGGAWLLARWLGDHNGGARFYRTIVQGRALGVAAVEAAAGQDFAALIGDFALALYTDSIAGQPKDAVPIRNTFTTRTLASLYPAGNYPLQPLPLTGSSAGALPPGGLAYYRLTTTGSSPVVLNFSTPGGAPVASRWRPQLSIFRLP